MHKSSENGFARLKLPATLESLSRFQDFIRKQVQECRWPQDKLFKLQLALEEALVNVMKYAYPEGGSGWVEVGCRLEGRTHVWVEVRDGGRAFNPFDCEKPDLTSTLGQRKVGGLGIFLLQQMADHAAYRREHDMNILTLGFRLTGP